MMKLVHPYLMILYRFRASILQASDFATWSDEQSGDDISQRKKILKLFDDDYWEN